MESYKVSLPVDCNLPIDASNLKGKTAIVTGGANGLGEAYVRALVGAGVNVYIGDLNVPVGSKLVDELGKEAASVTGKIDFVVANAGIAPSDDIFSFAGKGNSPTEPSLKAVEVNLNGALYTTKLALHYFISQNGEMPSPEQQDTCLVLIGSGAAFLDVPRGPTYPATKWAARGIMHSLRRTTHYHRTRVNMISPWYVKTSILSKDAFAHIADSGVEFATVDDAGNTLLRILSDHSIHGKSLFLSARKWAPAGYLDLDIDDYPGSDLLQEIQFDQMRSAPVDLGLFID